jgi:hypothetical protein
LEREKMVVLIKDEVKTKDKRHWKVPVYILLGGDAY